MNQTNQIETQMDNQPDTQVKVAVRGRGKVHPAWQHSRYGLMVACSCPGSQNGSLEKAVRKVADGWEMANCGN